MNNARAWKEKLESGKWATAIRMAGSLFIAALLARWFWIEWNDRAVNHDLFWLYTGFKRLIAGGTMAHDFYETNPPLSVFIYTPSFLMAHIGVLDLLHANLLYALLLLLLSLGATYGILRQINFVGRRQIGLICFSLLITATLFSVPNFGQRDHILALGALPFASLVLARSWGFKVSWVLALPVLVIGTLLLLLKPYYGLLPAVLMLHRVFVQKRISAAFDSDFLIMALVTVAYAVSMLIFFSDYLTVILPEVVSFYASSGQTFNPAKLSLYSAFLMFLMGFAVRRNACGACRPLVMAYIGFSILSFIVFLIMMKGYAYHMIPSLVFFMAAFCLITDDALKKKAWPSSLTFFLIIIMMPLIVLIMPKAYFPQPQVIKDQEITKIVSDCGDDCRFLILGGTVRSIQLISFYSGKEHASRFSKLWFLDGLLSMPLPERGEAILAHQRHNVDMVAADIDFYKPDIIFACNYIIRHIPVYMQVKSFRESFSRYRKTGKTFYDFDIFHVGKKRENPIIVSCDIYERS